MKEIINNKYNNLILNSSDFRQFVENMDKLSNDEIVARYEAKNAILSYLYSAGLGEMQPSI